YPECLQCLPQGQDTGMGHGCDQGMGGSLTLEGRSVEKVRTSNSQSAEGILATTNGGFPDLRI
ncbi:hypothetical protein, partial [Novosphingobium rosa]|uniref:hypothetical protein n=1 Tax=Novosphingobium rosa TaxID=76978 RepID=UPI001C3FA1E2